MISPLNKYTETQFPNEKLIFLTKDIALTNPTGQWDTNSFLTFLELLPVMPQWLRKRLQILFFKAKHT